MSEKKALALAKERDHIVAQIAYERALIAQNADSLRRLTHLVDKLTQGVRYLKKHPEVLLLPAAIIMVSRPRRLWTWAGSSLGVWRMVQVFRNRILH